MNFFPKPITLSKPRCKKCLYNVKNTCKLFTNHYLTKPSELNYISTDECREDTSLCGPDGKYYKPISIFKCTE